MIKVVIDTNVFVRGLLNADSIPGQVLREWKNGRFLVVSSSEIVVEMQRVLNYPKIRVVLRKHGIHEDELKMFFSTLQFSALLVDPSVTIAIISEDPSGNKFLACAEAADAKYLVSGDDHLLALHACKKTIILPPREFLDILIK